MQRIQIFFLLLATSILLSVMTSCDQAGLCKSANGPTETLDLDLATVDGLHLKGNGTVHLSYGTTQSVSVQAPQPVLDALDIQASSGLLVLDIDGCFRNSFTLDYYVTIVEPLTEISVSGSGEVIGDTQMPAADALTLDISGSGEITLDTEATDISSRISGSGDLKLSGTAQSHSLNISGSGESQAFQLICVDHTIKVSGSGEAELFCDNGQLTVDISGAGSVYYKGDPASVDTRITGSGSLKDAN